MHNVLIVIPVNSYQRRPPRLGENNDTRMVRFHHNTRRKNGFLTMPDVLRDLRHLFRETVYLLRPNLLSPALPVVYLRPNSRPVCLFLAVSETSLFCDSPL